MLHLALLASFAFGGLQPGDPAKCSVEPTRIDPMGRALVVVGDSVIPPREEGLAELDRKEIWSVYLTCWNPETGRFDDDGRGIAVVRVTTRTEMERVRSVFEGLVASVSMAAGDGVALGTLPGATRYAGIHAELLGEGPDWALEVTSLTQTCLVDAQSLHLLEADSGLGELCLPRLTEQEAALRRWYRERSGVAAPGVP